MLLPLLFPLLFLSSSARSLDVLVYLNSLGKSHVAFADGLIEALVRHGHQVDLILTRMNSLVRSNGSAAVRRLVTVDFPDGSPWDTSAAHLQDPFTFTPSWTPFLTNHRRTFADLSNKMCAYTLDSVDVQNLLSSTVYNVALVSAYDFCAFGLLAAAGVRPVTSFVATPPLQITTKASGVPELPAYENWILDARVSPNRLHFIDRLLDTYRTWHASQGYWYMAEQYTALFRSRYGDKFPDAVALTRNVTFDFANTNMLLAETRPLPPRAKLIGGIGMQKPKPLSRRFDELLNVVGCHGAVIISFGTQVPSSVIPRHVLDSFDAAAHAFPEFNFVFKYDGPVTFNSSNLITVDWLPQTDLLYDSRVVGFVSHVGLNSLTESAFAGVPLVAIPLFADQMHNAWRASQLGIGRTLSKYEISPSTMIEALHFILREPSTRARSKELAEQLLTFPEQIEKIFIESIEYAAKYKNLHGHLQVTGALLSDFAHYGHDILLTAASVALVILLLSGMLLWRCAVMIGAGVLHAVIARRAKAKVE